ncbi:MAG: M14 family metallopeptidase [bacterium]
MRPLFTQRRIVIGIIALLGVGFLIYCMVHKNNEQSLSPEPIVPDTSVPKHDVIGSSVEGRPIDAYTYGNGTKHLVFVGGIHGGYEWNSVILAYTFIDYLDANRGVIPTNMTITVIPSANPDGVYKVIGKEGRFSIDDVPSDISKESARFNAHNVDINRNFGCKWKPKSTWKGNPVSAGSAAFSEPEAAAIRDFALENKPNAFIFWHSQANTVYASECENGALPETLEIMKRYATAAKYDSVASFDAYEVTGDAEGWLASIDIPAITVELKTHETIEWEQNLDGIKALFEYYKDSAEQ